MKIEASIRQKIESQFSPTYFELENESAKHRTKPGAETHFRIVVVSKVFQGLSRVDRQRMVAKLFDEERGAGLHALSQKVFTPEEWLEYANKLDLQSPACQSHKKPKV